MLIWLDSTVNKKAHPNENYAREVMELFSLGRGHYTEKDVQEAARAFTGWFVIRDEFSVVPRQHDDGPKTVLGRKGNWSGDDIPGILLDQPACAEWICRKLFRLLRERVALALRGPARPAGAGLPRVGLPGPGAGRDDPAFEPVLRRRRCGGGGSSARSSSRSARSGRWKSSSRRSQAGRAGAGVRPDGPEPLCAPERGRLGLGAGLDQLDDAAGPGQPGPGPALGRRRGHGPPLRPGQAGRPPRLPPPAGGRPVPARPAAPRAGRAAGEGPDLQGPAWRSPPMARPPCATRRDVS